MTPEQLFHARLQDIVDVHTERGTWFALWPVRTPAGWTWLRRVTWVRYFTVEGFVTRYE